MHRMPFIKVLFLTLAAGLAGEAEAIILADGEVTYDFAPVSSPVSSALTPADVRVGRTARGNLTVDGGSRLRMDSGGGFDPFLVVGRRAGSQGSAVVIDNGAIDMQGIDLSGGVNVHVGRDSFGRMTIRNGAELNLVNPDRGNRNENGAGLVVGRSAGGGDLLIDDGSVRIDSGNSAFAVGREGAAASVTVRNGSTVVVRDSGPIDGSGGSGVSIGRSGTANATMTVDGSDVTVSSSEVARIFVGQDQATGRLDVSGPTSDLVIDAPDARLVVGRDAASTGLVRVEGGARALIAGAGSRLEIARVGGAQGHVVIAGGAVVDLAGIDGDVRVAADLTGFGSANDGGVGRLTVAGAGSRLNVQDAVVAGSPLSFGGIGVPSAEIVVANGGSITADRMIMGRGATLSGSGGSVFASVVNDGGLIAAGSSTGILTVDNFEQSSGTLAIEIAGLLPDQFDILNVLGDAVFTGGSIQFSFIDGFLPSAGDIIPFLTTTGGIEIFGTDFSVLGAASGFDFSVGIADGALAFLANNDATAVSEPPLLWTLLFALSGVGILLARRRPDRACVTEFGRHPA